MLQAAARYIADYCNLAIDFGDLGMASGGSLDMLVTATMSVNYIQSIVAVTSMSEVRTALQKAYQACKTRCIKL